MKISKNIFLQFILLVRECKITYFHIIILHVTPVVVVLC